jgi:eukaryotic-like serine/threonine-protein kinase
MVCGSMRLQPGTPVTANVRLERPLAQGAMGSVWLAEHLTLNTKVAVKFISDRLDPDDPEVLERFIREATAAAQIKSSHVVQTFDQGVMRDGTPYIVMEYLEGEGLGARLARIGRLPLAEAFRIVLQSTKALGSAHKAGIIHRDIKPDNIFLSTHDDDLHVKIFDFGIAKHRVDFDEQHGPNAEAQLGLTNVGVMIGTPEFMSPEQVASASQVDHRADLWALAAVAYVCLTGRLPFAGKDVSDLCMRLLEADFVRPSALRPELPAALDGWFERAFARSIDDRFQSAREMAAALALVAPALVPETDPSGPFMRGAQASFPDFEGERGIRGPTFSGAAADAVTGRRLSPPLVGAFVVAIVAVGGAALFFAATRSGAPAADSPVVERPTPAAAVESGLGGDDAMVEHAPVVDDGPEDLEAAAPTATPTTSAPAVGAPPPPRLRARPQRKNPGF